MKRDLTLARFRRSANKDLEGLTLLDCASDFDFDLDLVEDRLSVSPHRQDPLDLLAFPSLLSLDYLPAVVLDLEL